MDDSCVNCQEINPVGAGFCVKCGASLLAGQTFRLSAADIQLDETALSAKRGWGKAFIDSPQPLILEIAGQQLMLPPQPIVIIGRWSRDAILPQLDVDLSRFDAAANGVSRRHIMITRSTNLVYITDLNASNGTWLNDQQLVAHSQRVLRNNDQLQLGRLHMRVLFGTIAGHKESTVSINTAAYSD